MGRATEQIITAWWNDTMRKDYRTALADPDIRHERLQELAAMIDKARAAELCDLLEAVKTGLQPTRTGPQPDET